MSSDPVRAGDAGDRYGDVAVLYRWVRRTREGLFRYLATVPPEVLTREHPAFRGSMQRLLVHSAEAYLYWTGHVGLGGEAPESERAVAGLDDVRALFRQVDDVVLDALAHPGGLGRSVRWRDRRLPLRYLVLHPITHEFHHKGQVVSLGRLLGHPVPEGTDLDLALPD